MASQPGREAPHRDETALERARKELFEEGISTSRMYLDPERPGRRGHPRPDRRRRPLGVHVRRRRDLAEFHERAVVGVQSGAGYDEGRPQGTWAIGERVRDLVIAIDGPAGAGKSTVGRALAGRLGLRVPRHRGDVPGRRVRRAAPGHRRSPTTTAVAELARAMALSRVRRRRVSSTASTRPTAIRGRGGHRGGQRGRRQHPVPRRAAGPSATVGR